MSDYFWWAVDWVYDHRLTSAEAAGACASGATIGSPGGYVGAGGGCALSAISSAISKFFTPTAIHYTGSPTTAIYVPDCPIPDLELGFGNNSDAWPTVSSGWT